MPITKDLLSSPTILHNVGNYSWIIAFAIYAFRDSKIAVVTTLVRCLPAHLTHLGSNFEALTPFTCGFSIDVFSMAQF